MSDLVTDKKINKGLQGAGGIAGGIALLVLNGMAFPAALIAGGVLSLIGFFMIRKPRLDGKTNKGGLIALGVGILTAVSTIPILSIFSGALLIVGGVGLIAGGAYSLFNLIKGKKE